MRCWMRAQEGQGVGERSRADGLLGGKDGKRDGGGRGELQEVGRLAALRGGSPAAGGVCWVVHSLGLVYPGVREKEASAGGSWCGRCGWVVAGQEVVLQGVGGLAALRGFTKEASAGGDARAWWSAGG